MLANAMVPFHLNFQIWVDSSGLLRLKWTNEDAPSPEIFHDSLCNASAFNKLLLELVMHKLPNGREFLEKNKEEFSWSGLVLEFGEEFRADASEPWRLRRPWKCYENTWELITQSRGLIKYAEGICVTPFGGLLHSWGVHNGRAVDTTWPAPHLNRYFGVVFEEDFLRSLGLHGGVFCRWDPVRDYLCKRRAS